MKIEIKNCFSGGILYSVEAKNLKEGIEIAIKNGANLVGAYLRGAYLRGADLWGANLVEANLVEANLGGANLRGADLWGANLRGANLGGANLVGANLGGANLVEANLGGANLRGANLWGANLGGANLWGADLWGADIQYCLLKDIKIDKAEQNARNRLKTLIPPEEYERYINFGFCCVDGAMFGLFELVMLPDGWYCTAVQSTEQLPPTDRMMTRILHWRKGREHFLKIANKRIG